MKLILCRHGNTFAPGDKVVWTGSANDLPLVEKGYEQAQKAGQWITEQGWKTPTVYCSALQRTKNYAIEMMKAMGLPSHLAPIVTPHLDEVDYGSWTGLSDVEVVEKFGEESLNNWREKSVFPPGDQWHETEEQVVNRVQECLNNLKQKHRNKTVILVSSNGILRYFLKQDTDLFDKKIAERNFAVKTGHICALDFEDEAIHLLYWSHKPE